MKIVQVNTVCSTGSTGKICISLYHLSKAFNFTPYIAYGRNTAPKEINGYKIGSKPDFYFHVLRNFIKGENGFGSSRQTIRFIDWLEKVQPDIIHLHNIHGFYLNIEILFEYLKKINVPVIWTLHDCWPFTGHCAHFSYIKCNKWVNGCYSCPQHRQAYPYAIFKDNSIASYQRKKNTFTGISNMTIVTPSRWLKALVKNSFLKEYNTVVIPNGIDLTSFIPPSIRNTSSSPHIVLGVANVWTYRKWIQYFEKLAHLLDDNYIIQLVGLNKKQVKYFRAKYPAKVIPLQRTECIEDLISLYQNAHVFVNPTLEDTFPTTNLEALACGTPVITFKTGGSPESITEKCGIVVEQGDISGLLQAILSIENHPLITPENCRQQALLYSDKDNFLNYIRLYQKVLAAK